jgi:hypothetical protein
MSPTLPRPDRPDVRLEQTLRRATSGRLQGVSIQNIGDRLIVRGCAPSYYVKQLAIEAARTLAGDGELPIVLDVVVAS